MPKVKNEATQAERNAALVIELGTTSATKGTENAKKAVKETVTKSKKDPAKNLEAEKPIGISNSNTEAHTQTDDFSSMEITQETEVAVNATAAPVLEDNAELRDNEQMQSVIKISDTVPIGLPQIVTTISSNAEPVTLSPKSEVILEVPLTELYPPEFHPFQVNHDEAMDRLSSSIKEYGVHEPGVARPKFGDNGTFNGYELLVGNRRKMACELAGLSTMPVIIRELDDDSAVIMMVDSNLEQREKILYSEKAWAYKIKMEALNHKGIKSVNGKTSAEIITEQTGDSRNHIFRLIRLTELVIGLLDKVDNEDLSFHSAVELSYLSQKEQLVVMSAMDANDIKPSVSQAVKLKNLKQSGELTEELIYSILAEEKPKSRSAEIKIRAYRKYFPADYTPNQIAKVITDLLKAWQKEHNAELGQVSTVTGGADNA